MWKKIKDYPDYEINRFGEIKRGNKTLKSQPATNGYTNICLCKNGKAKMFRLHRLLAETFIPNPENKPQINHIDGNKKNNDLSNLEWVTASENALHAIYVTKNKISPRSMMGKFGSEHNRSKSFFIENENGLIVNYESGLQFSRLTGLDNSSVSWARKKGLKSYSFKRGKMKGLTVHFELIP